MTIATRSLVAVLSGTVLLLGALTGPAFGITQVYKAKLLCNDPGVRGTAQVKTLIKSASPQLREPFFRVVVNLAGLPDDPVVSCQVALGCDGDPDVFVFDCEDAVKPQGLSFVSEDIFAGALPGAICHDPRVVVSVVYDGQAKDCTPGF